LVLDGGLGGSDSGVPPIAIEFELDERDIAGGTFVLVLRWSLLRRRTKPLMDDRRLRRGFASGGDAPVPSCKLSLRDTRLEEERKISDGKARSELRLLGASERSRSVIEGAALEGEYSGNA
jgi:hypothetical protein